MTNPRTLTVINSDHPLYLSPFSYIDLPVELLYTAIEYDTGTASNLVSIVCYRIGQWTYQAEYSKLGTDVIHYNRNIVGKFTA